MECYKSLFVMTTHELVKILTISYAFHRNSVLMKSFLDIFPLPMKCSLIIELIDFLVQIIVVQDVFKGVVISDLLLDFNSGALKKPLYF